MICDNFDPITASCAPCCIVCSQRGHCGNRTGEEQANERRANTDEMQIKP